MSVFVIEPYMIQAFNAPVILRFRSTLIIHLDGYAGSTVSFKSVIIVLVVNSDSTPTCAALMGPFRNITYNHNHIATV